MLSGLTAKCTAIEVAIVAGEGSTVHSNRRPERERERRDRERRERGEREEREREREEREREDTRERIPCCFNVVLDWRPRDG